MECGKKLKIFNEKDSTKAMENSYNYQIIIESLLYAAYFTRPDISYSVEVLSKFNYNPTKKHWMPIKKMMRYIRGTFAIKVVQEH